MLKIRVPALTQTASLRRPIPPLDIGYSYCPFGELGSTLPGPWDSTSCWLTKVTLSGTMIRLPEQRGTQNFWSLGFLSGFKGVTGPNNIFCCLYTWILNYNEHTLGQNQCLLSYCNCIQPFSYSIDWTHFKEAGMCWTLLNGRKGLMMEAPTIRSYSFAYELR